ncbi:MAG: hypothetical protein V4710_02030, partial [Verrucomicrobiota bacterium]
FALRHPGVATAPEYYQVEANFLSNSAEELALVAANGSDIERFTYGDQFPWPPAPDGDGPSLVRIVPRLNTNPNDSLQWRASSSAHGNPGTHDATLSLSKPDDDDDHDGLLNMVEYALGAGALPGVENTLLAGVPLLELTIERDPLAEASWEIESSSSLANWVPATAMFSVVERTPLANGVERITFRANSPAGTTQFLRSRIRVNP